MASKSSSNSLNPSLDPNSLKLAIAIALLRYKKLHQQSSSSSTSEVDAQRWKRKAKERKREVLRLREELKQLEDGAGGGPREVFPEVLSCRCYFFDGCGKLSPRKLCLEGEGRGDGSDSHGHWIDEVLRRRFLRHVRWKERRKRTDDSVHSCHLTEINGEDEMERLSTSVDFLVELSDTASHVKEKNNHSFSSLSHQAVDFILASLKNLLLWNKGCELIEEIVHGLVTRLIKRMCTTSEKDGPLDSGLDDEFFVQHLIRKLGNEPYIGQRALLSISQRLSILADSLLFMDPFDDAFLDTHNCVFMMMQLIEFLISDYIQIWMSNEDFDQRLFEEWLRSVLQARKCLELLECRNGLYVVYIERVVGELAKQVWPLSRQGKLDLDILSDMFS